MSDGDLAPVAGVLLGRTVPPEHARALVAAGVLPAPTAEGLVPTAWLAALDPDPVPALPPGEWHGHLVREVRRFRDGRTRLVGASGPERAGQRERQLSRIGSAAWGAALALLMEGYRAEAWIWLDRAATLYRRSLADAEPGSWGRSIGCLKCRLLAGDLHAAAREARWTLELEARDGASPIARYAATIALLTLSRDEEARPLAAALVREPSFPAATATALLALVHRRPLEYEDAVREVLRTFETRDRFLEDVPVADTVMMLQILARGRVGVPALSSTRLPRLAGSPVSASAAAG